MASHQFTSAVGQKFHANGSARVFPGNSVICFIGTENPCYQQAVWLQEQVSQQPFGSRFALLPPGSFHMTVIDLVCEQVREPERWSRFLPLDAPQNDVDEFFISALAKVQPPQNFRMKFHTTATFGGLRIDVLPADHPTYEAIHQYREEVAQATGVRLPDHDSYQFHVSLAYRLVQLDSAEELALEAFLEQTNNMLRETFPILNTGQPHLVFFDDMFRFVVADQRRALATRS